LIIVAVLGLIVVIFGLIFAGVLPGLQKNGKNPKKVQANLEFWGVGDTAQSYEEIFSNFKTVYPDVTINYRGFENADDYEIALLDSLAAGKGPDIFMIQNASLSREMNKIAPAPATKLSLLALRQFPKIVEQNFASQNSVYGLPLSIDTLALIYNRDLLNQTGVAVLPENWEDFTSLVPKLVKTDSAKKIERAGAAIGGSAKTIDGASPLLYALMLQTGTKMTSVDFKSATFASKEGLHALNFYAQFADAKNKTYTWNDALPNSLDAISQGTAVMIFNYASSIQKIKSRNAFIDLGVAPLPQPKTAGQALAYANYWGYVVSRQSKNQNLAWDFVIKMTTDAANANTYVKQTKKPPALLALIDQYLNDPNLNVFARQALIARSWPQADPKKIDEIFSRMIEAT
ncbi:MAG: extracellular solute-binding protein, partial [Patescibacteria group bacterium]